LSAVNFFVFLFTKQKKRDIIKMRHKRIKLFGKVYLFTVMVKRYALFSYAFLKVKKTFVSQQMELHIFRAWLRHALFCFEI